MNKNIRTDLALEMHEFLRNEASKTLTEEPKVNYIPGVEIFNSGDDEIKITRVKVVSQEGEKAIGKPIGNYITLEVQGIKQNNPDFFERTCKELAKEITRILNIKKDGNVLIIGLGNWNITPDSLGPKVMSSLMITRHLLEYVPEQVDEGVRPVCAMAPGVLGITGIETGEIVKGIVDRINPDLVIAIDALAARSMERISTTIQLADTGISPGSGVGNKRMEISENTLGVPVIAIGVPTVIDAVTMSNDILEIAIENIRNNENRINELNSEDIRKVIQQTLSGIKENLMVTPKEIDILIDRIAKVIANGLNIALHEGIDLQDVNRYI